MERSPGQRNLAPLGIEVEIVGLSSEETCEGAGFSPQVRIEGLGSAYLALILEDTAPSSNVYWLIWNVDSATVPRNLPKEAEIDKPVHCRQGRNLRGDYGYAAPCPAPGEEGRYVLRAYGLDRMLDIDPTTTTKDDLIKTMDEHVKEYGESILTYSRKKQWSASSEY